MTKEDRQENRRIKGKARDKGRTLQIEVVEELHRRHRLRLRSPISKLDQIADIVTLLGHLCTREGG
jgi:hypothetical protein